MRSSDWSSDVCSSDLRHIFEEECAAAGAPRLVPFGVNMVAPVIMKFSTAEQKAHYLPRILDLTDWWCQGYSEPGAGPDLASLKTRAVHDGHHFVVNGQKPWNPLGPQDRKSLVTGKMGEIR